eukprot:TRINITY_DN14469_c0_g1_i2.p1 TRINITY_DN14469_c0_g1~~TRINITY_DN14469_c0_g1_i2.p1  ORF type:complete len:589 (-),score=156.40 TRINITY_DN14469_c0_g1_i2:335-2101(-)
MSRYNRPYRNDGPPRVQAPRRQAEREVPSERFRRAILASSDDMEKQRKAVYNARLALQYAFQGIAPEANAPLPPVEAFPAGSLPFNAHVTDDIKAISDAFMQQRSYQQACNLEVTLLLQEVGLLMQKMGYPVASWNGLPFAEPTPAAMGMPHAAAAAAAAGQGMPSGEAGNAQEATAEPLRQDEEEISNLELKQQQLRGVAEVALNDVLEIMCKPHFKNNATETEQTQHKVIARVLEDLQKDEDSDYMYVAQALIDLAANTPENLPPTQRRSYYVDKDKLCADGHVCTPGLPFYRSTNLDDKADVPIAPWGSFVVGVPVDNGKEWVQTDALFLPVKVTRDDSEGGRQRVLFAVDHVVRAAERALRDVIVLRIARKARPRDRCAFDLVAAKVFGEARDTKLLSQLYLAYSKVMERSSWSFLSKAQLTALKKGPRARRDASPSRRDASATSKEDEKKNANVKKGPMNAGSSTDEQPGLEPQYIQVPPAWAMNVYNATSTNSSLFDSGLGFNPWDMSAFTGESGSSSSHEVPAEQWQYTESDTQATAGWSPFWPEFAGFNNFALRKDEDGETGAGSAANGMGAGEASGSTM